MNAPDKFAPLLTLTREPFPASTKVFVPGTLPGVHVPMREIALTNGERVTVYDTSGPYTDPDARIDLATGKACAHLVRQHIQLAQVAVADVPVVDGRLHVADVAEVAIEPDDAFDVVGVVAALQHSLARSVQVWVGLIEYLTQLVVALGHRDGLAVTLVRAFITVVGVQVEVIDGVFLSLGPQALARDIGAYRR